MAPDKIEISDIGMPSHNKWAKAQEDLAKAPRIKEDIQIVGPAQADVTTSSYVSAVKAFVGQDQTNVPFAIIEAPAILATKRTNIYKEDVLPGWNNERLQGVKDRLKSLPETPYGG